MEAKVGIGGYGIFDVADLDEAVALARTFLSPTGKLEVRPAPDSLGIPTSRPRGRRLQPVRPSRLA
jgi:hypothetical protein